MVEHQLAIFIKLLIKKNMEVCQSHQELDTLLQVGIQQQAEEQKLQAQQK